MSSQCCPGSTVASGCCHCSAVILVWWAYGSQKDVFRKGGGGLCTFFLYVFKYFMMFIVVLQPCCSNLMEHGPTLWLIFSFLMLLDFILFFFFTGLHQFVAQVFYLQRTISKVGDLIFNFFIIVNFISKCQTIGVFSVAESSIEWHFPLLRLCPATVQTCHV